jgi:cyclopropane fatty-acyl-phospholipid synthase-like methyltransferase
MNKPCSEACLRNQEPIYQVLSNWFNESGRVLEIGCGTGQHSVYLCQRMPHLQWLPSDLEAAIAGAKLWIEEAALDNLQSPVMLDLSADTWDIPRFDYIFTANTLHFVSWERVENLFTLAANHLYPNGRLAIYGPFNVNQAFTSEGNERLDQWVKSINPNAGIKDRKDIIQLAALKGFSLEESCTMPANNMMLLFRG